MDELRKQILLFDKSRAETGIKGATGHITKKEAHREFETDISRLTEVIEGQKLEARIDENRSLLSVTDHEIQLGDKCYLHDKYVGQCAACRKRSMFYKVCIEWRASIKERIDYLESQHHKA